MPWLSEAKKDVISCVKLRGGAKETGVGYLDILSGISLRYTPFSVRSLMVETMKKAPVNNPNPANRKAPLSPNLNARKLMEKLRQEQIPDTMMTTPFHMTLPLSLAGKHPTCRSATREARRLEWMVVPSDGMISGSLTSQFSFFSHDFSL